jgi:hypothetical protein
MSASDQPIVRRPGPGWRFVGSACWKHTSGVGVHVLGLAFMPDGTVRRASEWPASGMADGYIRLAGGNRKRGLMMWALALYHIQQKAEFIADLQRIAKRDFGTYVPDNRGISTTMTS